MRLAVKPLTSSFNLSPFVSLVGNFIVHTYYISLRTSFSFCAKQTQIHMSSNFHTVTHCPKKLYAFCWYYVVCNINPQGYRTLAALVSRPWGLMEILSKEEIINIVTDATTETAKIGKLSKTPLASSSTYLIWLNTHFTFLTQQWKGGITAAKQFMKRSCVVTLLMTLVV